MTQTQLSGSVLIWFRRFGWLVLAIAVLLCGFSVAGQCSTQGRTERASRTQISRLATAESATIPSMGEQSGFFGYYREFSREFVAQSYESWKSELRSTIGVAVVAFGFSYSHDKSGLEALLLTLKAGGIWLLLWAAWHLICTPWRLDGGRAKVAATLAAENAGLLQSNKELEVRLKELEATATTTPIQNIYLPAPPSPLPEPLKHNVRCVGVEIEPDFPMVRICFRNIEIPGEPVGRFKAARLKINYYLESSGEEVAEIFPARWIGFPDQDEIEVGVKKVCAVLAMHSRDSDIGWEAHSTNGIPAEIDWKYTTERTFLPSDSLKIVANLIGENNLSMDKPIKGVLTLREDRSASWSLTE